MPTREEKALLTRLERIAKTAEEAIEYLHTIMEEPEVEEDDDDIVHAEYDTDEKGFICLSGRKKSCKENVFEPGEMVAHLRDEHNIDPEDQGIDGWTARHEKKAIAFLEELDSEDEEEEEDTAYTRAELKGMGNAELKEILDEWEVEYKSKANKTTLVKLVLDSQGEDEEEEEPEDDDDVDDDETDVEYTVDGLSGKTNAQLKEILTELGGKFAKKTKKTDLISRILDTQEGEEEEEDEEEEDEEFVKHEMKDKAVKAFAKEHGLEKDEVRLIIDFANEEHVSLADAADEFELVEEGED